MSRIRINQFGGMNNHAEPHLLEKHQAARLINADTSSGALRPLPAGMPTGQPHHESLAYSSKTRSLVHWGNQYFWSDNKDATINSSANYFGVDPPSKKPNVTPGVDGTLFAGDYQYLITYTTDEGRESSAVRPGFPLDFSIAHVRTKRTITISAETSIEPFNPKNVLHPAYGVGYKVGTLVTYNGHTWEAIGTGPTGDKTGWLASYENGVWGRWNPLTILEWQWPGNEDGQFWKDLGENPTTTEISGSDELIVSKIPQPESQAITGINLYRTVADGSDFFLVAELSLGTTTYVDRTPDNAIITSSVLDYTKNDLPPIYVAGEDGNMTRVGGRYLTELAGTFYLAYEDRLYLSEQSNPHGWNPLHFQTFEEIITGLAKDDGGIIVFSANRMWRVTGTTFSNMVVKEIPERQGCPNWRTIVTMRNRIIWQSNDGICAFSPHAGRDGRYVQILTENTYDFYEQGVFAAVAHEIYWLFRESDVVCMDLKTGYIYERTIRADGAFYNVNEDTFFTVFSNSWIAMNYGSASKLKYVSPALAGDASRLKRFRRIWISSSGLVKVTPIVDGQEHSAFHVAKNSSAFFPAGLTGDSLQVILESTGSIQSYTIDYEVIQ